MTTIQITKPEVETLINERLQSGAFLDAEDVILQALRAAPKTPARVASTRTGADLVETMQGMPFDIDLEDNRPSVHGKSLEEVFAMVRGLADDLDFSRDPSCGRPVDLS